jgi:hypothetical protein
MKFGVFDHMDDAGLPLGQLYADRLRLVEAYDRAGLRGTTSPNTIRRRWAVPPRPGCSSRRRRSAPGRCASALWSTCCRSIIRCA